MLLSKLTSSRQSSAASRRSGYAKAAACSVCHVPHQSTVRRIEAVLRNRGRWPCHCFLCLTDPKKREVLLHLPREKKIEFQERIYNQHVRLLSSEPFYSGRGADIVMQSLHSSEVNGLTAPPRKLE